MKQNTKTITVVGAGRMGSAVSLALFNKGYAITSYDLFIESAKKLEEHGIQVKESPLEAAEASDVILFSINAYQGCLDFLQTPGVLTALENKTVIQLSTGTPAEVAALTALLEPTSIAYFEGKIMCYPQDVGTDDAFIVYSGNKSLYEELSDILGSLSNTQLFVNEEMNGAATLDLAILTTYYGLHWSVIQGAMICKQNGIDLAIFKAATTDYAIHTVEGIMENSLPAITSGKIDSDMASNHVHAAALSQCISALESSQLDATVAKDIWKLFKQTIENGDGDKNVEAITKAMIN